jgi:hypothetical protein
VRNSSLVSLTPVSDDFTVQEGFTGVNNEAEKFLTGVNDTGKGNLTSVNDSSNITDIAKFLLSAVL